MAPSGCLRVSHILVNKASGDSVLQVLGNKAQKKGQIVPFLPMCRWGCQQEEHPRKPPGAAPISLSTLGPRFPFPRALPGLPGISQIAPLCQVGAIATQELNFGRQSQTRVLLRLVPVRASTGKNCSGKRSESSQISLPLQREIS